MKLWKDQCRRKHWAWGTLCLAALASCAGCGDLSGRVGVNGRVTFTGGQSIDRGMIEFAPLDAATSAGSGAAILDGEYQIQRAKGLLPGKYRVRIYAPTLVKAEPGAPGALGLAPPRERVAKQFSVKSQLTAAVTGTSDLTLDFEVELSELQE